MRECGNRMVDWTSSWSLRKHDTGDSRAHPGAIGDLYNEGSDALYFTSDDQLGKNNRHFWNTSEGCHRWHRLRRRG